MELRTYLHTHTHTHSEMRVNQVKKIISERKKN